MTSLTLGTSIIIPCKNEAGNIQKLINEIIKITGNKDEIILVEGGSSDRTWEVMEEMKELFPSKIQIVKQSGKGKFDAIKDGSKVSNCKTLMIWDADATVNFEQNKNIFISNSNHEILLTGDRLKGLREKGSMKFANFIGNWAFSLIWTIILWQKPIDLLCGTKKFPKSILANIPTRISKMDPFGDFTILACAKISGLEIKSIPVLYHARSYGKTNIKRWRSGLKLIQITLVISALIVSTKFKETINKDDF